MHQIRLRQFVPKSEESESAIFVAGPYPQSTGAQVQHALFSHFLACITAGSNFYADLRCHRRRDLSRRLNLIPARGGTPDHVRDPYSRRGPDRVLRNGSAAFHTLIEFFLKYALELGMQGPMRCHQDLTVLVELDLVGEVLEARIGNNVGLVHGPVLVKENGIS